MLHTFIIGVPFLERKDIDGAKTAMAFPVFRSSSMKQLTDKQLLERLFANDQRTIVYCFYQKYLPIFQYHIGRLFPQGADVEELVNELFLYLYEDDWRRLKTFNGTASLSTWISLISFRFFKQFKFSKIDSRGVVALNDKEDFNAKDLITGKDPGTSVDLEMAFRSISNERDQSIARALLLQDVEPKDIADKYDLTVDYVYTIKNRAVKTLRKVLRSYC